MPLLPFSKFCFGKSIHHDVRVLNVKNLTPLHTAGEVEQCESLLVGSW